MSWLTTLLGGGDTIRAVGDIADKFITTDAEKAEAASELKKAVMTHDAEVIRADAARDVAQAAVNQEEAKNPNFLVSGWRPAVGWVCVLALGIQYVAYPLFPLFGRDIPAPLDITMMYTLLCGMLGVAGLRTVDKIKGVATSIIGNATKQ